MFSLHQLPVAIDVCVVTKTGQVPPEIIKYIPVSQLIIETSKPLGMARARAISKVETEWFAFIDDDVHVGPRWFSQIASHIHADVGAICGRMKEKGMGELWDKAVNDHISKTNKPIVHLTPGQRGYTHNTLMRTELLKDWQPSVKTLSAYEDYEITQHVLGKAHRWLWIPNVDAWHETSWVKRWTGPSWAMQNKALLVSKRELVTSFYRSVGGFVKTELPLWSGVRGRIIVTHQVISLLWGILKALGE